MSTAWVLRGGASFGAAQVGMARALLEAGHQPDMIYGTSAGALNAAALATDPSLAGVDRLAELWTTITRKDVFPLQPWAALMGLAGFRDHIINPSHLARWLRATCQLRRLEDGAVPLVVATTDIQSGDEVLLHKGPAVPALMASSAMPAIFPPVRIGGRWLMDGSIASDTPIGPAVEAGATRVWVLPSVPTGEMARPRSALESLLRSTSVLLARHHADMVQTWSTQCQLYLLPAPLVPGTSPFRFTKSQELIDAAYCLAQRWLKHAQPVGAETRTEPVQSELVAGNRT